MKQYLIRHSICCCIFRFINALTYDFRYSKYNVSSFHLFSLVNLKCNLSQYSYLRSTPRNKLRKLQYKKTKRRKIVSSFQRSPNSPLPPSQKKWQLITFFPLALYASQLKRGWAWRREGRGLPLPSPKPRPVAPSKQCKQKKKKTRRKNKTLKRHRIGGRAFFHLFSLKIYGARTYKREKENVMSVKLSVANSVPIRGREEGGAWDTRFPILLPWQACAGQLLSLPDGPARKWRSRVLRSDWLIVVSLNPIWWQNIKPWPKKKKIKNKNKSRKQHRRHREKSVSLAMLLESRTLAGRKRNGLTLSSSTAYGTGSLSAEEDEEDRLDHQLQVPRVLLASKKKMQQQPQNLHHHNRHHHHQRAPTPPNPVPAGSVDEAEHSSSPSPNLLNNFSNNNNNNCNSNRQCATDFSIAAIMARDTREKQQQEQQQQQQQQHKSSSRHHHSAKHQHGKWQKLVWLTREFVWDCYIALEVQIRELLWLYCVIN